MSKKVNILGLLIFLLIFELSAQTTRGVIPKNWTQITFNTAEDFHANFSPDGTKIVFDSNRGDKYAVFVYDLETKKTKQLTSGKFHVTIPAGFPIARRYCVNAEAMEGKNFFLST